MTTVRLTRTIRIDDIVPTLTVEQDDIPVRGNAMASGDAAVDKAVEDEILRRLNDGDVWAWAQVCVSVATLGFTGQSYLCGCSYADESEFRQRSGYFDSMVAEARADLLQQLINAGFEVIR